MDDKPTAVGGEEHYSLRWNNHQAHLLRSFEALLHAETLVDVTLVCAERRVRAHKVLLGACSPLFRRIFSENPCKHPVIVLKDFQGWEVQAVVDFMYRGEVSVAQEQLGTVIRAGESLQVRGLADQDREEQARSPPPTPLARSPVQTRPPVPSPPASPASPQPRRKQARPRRRSGESDTPENLSMRRSPSGGLKAIRLSRPRSPPKQEQSEELETEVPTPPRMFQPHQDMFPPVPPAAVSALSLTPPHMFGLDSPLGLFPPGMEHKMYPLMDVEHRGPLDAQLFTNVKKKWRPKGQHSAPRGGPPRSWTNAELTEALQHVWNKKMTTSQASRIFGIPYNSLLMYVRGKYGKSLKLEQLRKDCIGGPLDVLNLNSGNNNNNHPSVKHHEKDEHGGQRPASSEPDISSNPMFNPFSQGFYPEFPPGFPMPLNMLHLLPPSEKARELYQSMPMALDSLSGAKEEDCKSDRSKENSADEEGDAYRNPHQPHPPDTRTLLHHNGQD